jgi:hypothetical protein
MAIKIISTGHALMCGQKLGLAVTLISRGPAPSELYVNDPAAPTTVPNIALRAYELWDEAGRPEGRSDEFYFLAEEEFRGLLELELKHHNQ